MHQPAGCEQDRAGRLHLLLPSRRRGVVDTTVWPFQRLNGDHAVAGDGRGLAGRQGSLVDQGSHVARLARQSVWCYAPVMLNLPTTELLTIIGIVVLVAVILVVLSRGRRSAG